MNSAVKILPVPLAIIESDEAKKLKQCCAGSVRIFVHFSLYMGSTVNFSCDIGVLSLDGIIKTAKDQGSMGKAGGVLTPTMFDPDNQL